VGIFQVEVGECVGEKSSLSSAAKNLHDERQRTVAEGGERES
jgi:hypothetical protein